MSQIELLRLLLNDPRLEFEELRTVGNALTGCTQTQSMAKIAIRLADDHSWISTREGSRYFAVEPAHPTPETRLFASKFYHVSERSFYDDIQQTGLKPTSGGHTSLGRSYAPRLHFTVWLKDALQFVHIKTSRPSPDATGTVRCRTLDEIDIYHATLPADLELFNDDLFDGRGVWTKMAVPTAEVSILDRKDWEPVHWAMYSELVDDSGLKNLPTVQE